MTVGPPYVINEDVKRRMKEAAERVRNGEFAKEWLMSTREAHRN